MANDKLAVTVDSEPDQQALVNGQKKLLKIAGLIEAVGAILIVCALFLSVAP